MHKNSNNITKIYTKDVIAQYWHKQCRFLSGRAKTCTGKI